MNVINMQIWLQWLLVPPPLTNPKSTPDASCSVTRERERPREAVQTEVQTHTFAVFSVFHRSLIKITNGWKDVAGAHSIRFLLDFHVYAFQSFVSLDGSEQSVFIRQLPYQLIV